MPEQVRREMLEHMDQSVDVLKSSLAKVQTGRANPAMIEDVSVDYYGTSMPLKQLATIAAPDPNLLVVQPYDKTQMDGFVKAILGAGLGLNPESDGHVIRVRIPKLSEERLSSTVPVSTTSSIPPLISRSTRPADSIVSMNRRDVGAVAKRSHA